MRPAPLQSPQAPRANQLRKRTAPRAHLALALLAALAGGCREEESTRDIWCSELCTMVSECTQRRTAGCRDDCIAGNRAYFERTTERTLQIEASCFILTSSCNVSDCTAEAGQVGATTASTGFCQTLSAEFFGCRAFASPDECGAYFGRFSSSALESGEACAGSPCDDLPECLDERLFTYGSGQATAGGRDEG